MQQAAYSLENLPYELGVLQNYIFSRAIYPDKAVAGITALSLVQAFLMPNFAIDCYGGLGFNENYLILTKTTFGKEGYIGEFDKFIDNPTLTPKFQSQRALPASKPGMHKQLENCAAQHYLVDEFGEYLVTTHNNSHRQEVIGYMMESYGRAFGRIAPSNTKDDAYKHVINPRVSMLAFSTQERAMEVMSTSHSTSGTYNRYIIHSSITKPTKRKLSDWKGGILIPQSTISLFKKILDSDETLLSISSEAIALIDQYDATYFEPIKEADYCFGGRLAAQMLKIAGAIAVSGGRNEIAPFDIELATSIRLSLYNGFKTELDSNGGLGNHSVSNKVLMQLRKAFKNLKEGEAIYISHLCNRSLSFKELEASQQQSVIRALIDEGTCMRSGKMLVKAL